MERIKPQDIEMLKSDLDKAEKEKTRIESHIESLVLSLTADLNATLKPAECMINL
jgi:hypothetical protein